MSRRPGVSEKRFSANRFRQLPDQSDTSNMPTNPNDATIDIPLAPVSSRSSKMNSSNAHPSDESIEKSGLNGYGFGGKRRTDNAVYEIENEEGGYLNRMGRIYQAILNFSIVTRYFIYVSPLALLIAIPIIVGATAAKDAKIGGVRIVWFFTWIEVVWLGLWVVKIFAHFLPVIFQFFAGIVSSGTKKYALVLRALEIPISLVGWAIVSLATFIPIMTQNPDNRRTGDIGIKPWESTVKQILFALLVCTLILLAEKTLVQLISINYHRKQYNSRIKESKRNVQLLGKLYAASRALFPEYCKEFREEDAIISDSILSGGTKDAGRRDSVMNPLRLIRNVGQGVGRLGDKVSAAVGNVAQELTGKQLFNSTTPHAIVINALERRRSREALAKRIWLSFVVEGKDALYLDDIVEVFGSGREEEAAECFAMLDRDGNGDVSLEEMILTVAEMGRVRKSIARSMHDVDQAIHVLDKLLMLVAFVIMVLVFVSFVTTGAGTVIAAGATTILSLSFVFATTAQEVLGSCVFLFVKHPFDVGDRVEINGQELFVEEISLLYTVFRTVAEQRITQVPNVVLNNNWIDNVTRSRAMRERITLTVDFGTTFADIQLLKAEMERFVRDKENCRDFQPDVDIEVIGLGNMDKLELRLEIRHKSNWSNETVRAARRSRFMCALVLAIRKIPINGPGGGGAALGDPSNPSYSVTITDELAQQYREKAEAEKEKKRMVPTDKTAEIVSRLAAGDQARSTGVDIGPSLSSRATEADFANALNARPAGYDASRADEFAQLYRSSNVSVPPETLAVPRSDGGNNGDSVPLRQPSTGRRKGGGPNIQVPTATSVESFHYQSQGYTTGTATPGSSVSPGIEPTRAVASQARAIYIQSGNAFAQQQAAARQSPQGRSVSSSRSSSDDGTQRR